MFNRIKNALVRSLREETISERGVRILPGVLYGFLAATIFSLTYSTINPITFPGFHIGVDWTRFFLYWGGAGLGMIIAGFIVGWFSESYMGIIGGGIIMTVLLLLGSLVISLINRSGAGSLATSFVTAIPLIGAAILFAGGLRLAINKHLQIRQEPDASIRRKRMAGLVAIVLLVGFIPGGLSRFEGNTVDILRSMNDGLAASPSDPSFGSRFPMDKLPGLESHWGVGYSLYPRISSTSAGSMDITVRFKDGYTFTCTMSTEGGAVTYFTDCNEGATFISP